MIANGESVGGYAAGVGGTGGHPKTIVVVVVADDGNDGEPQPNDATTRTRVLAQGLTGPLNLRSVDYRSGDDLPTGPVGDDRGAISG